MDEFDYLEEEKNIDYLEEQKKNIDSYYTETCRDQMTLPETLMDPTAPNQYAAQSISEERLTKYSILMFLPQFYLKMTDGIPYTDSFERILREPKITNNINKIQF